MHIYLSIPDDSTIESYDEKLFAMITGKVFDNDNKPLKDVKVTIKGHKGYGSVKTDENGSFAIPVEGGRDLIIRFKKDGYVSIDRKTYIAPQDWTITPDIILLQRDEKYSLIQMNSSAPRIHSSSKIIDERGERAAALVFEKANTAKAVDKDGNERELNTIKIRATEFKTPSSMPSDLPDTTAFTYCADITVDGVKDDESVVFDEPIAMYVDNFLGFNVGEIVPVGYYDRNKGEWVGSNNGVIVRLLDADGDGKVDSLDADNDGLPDDLNDNGEYEDEILGIKDSPEYQAGKTYQRAMITHLTPWDHNWPYVPEGDTKEPDGNKTEFDTEDPNEPNDTPVCTNSYITSKTRILHEDIDVAGTDTKLHYNTRKTDGFKYIISAFVDTSDLPFTALGAQSILEIGGSRFVKDLEFNKVNNVEFEWDGKDILGNRMSGAVSGKLITRYSYKLQYMYACASFGAITSFKPKISSLSFAEVAQPRYATACPQTFAEASSAWAQTGKYPSGIAGNELIYYDVEQNVTVQIEDLSHTRDNLANGWSIYDELYLKLNSKGTLSNTLTQKYIEVKNGYLFAVDDEPENRFSLPSFNSNKYYAWGISYNENCHGNRNRNIISLVFDFSDDGIVSNTSAKELGCFSDLGGYDLYSLSYLEPYDLLEYYKNTNFKYLPEWYIDASITPWGVKRKIKDRIDNNIESILPNWYNTDNYNISQYLSWQNEHDGMIWTSRITPNELLYEKFDNLYPDYDQIMYENPLYSNIGINKNDIVVFDKELGYVYDADKGLLRFIFDNPSKQIIRTYEHDDNLRLVSIKDQFDNKIEIARDYEGNPTSITAPNGQITRVFVNYKGDLTSITYEDGSAYLFEYNDNSLLASKRSPEGYYSSYFYNDKGRVIRQLDSNNAEWQFNKVNSNKATEYNVIKPQGDKLTYIDTREFDKTLTSLIKLPSGYSYSTSFDENKTLSNSIKDNVQTITQTGKDPLTLNTILKSQTIQMPSSLTKSITNDVSYTGDITNLQSKTQKLTINQKPITIKTDYMEGTITIIFPSNIKEILTYDKTTSLPLKYQYANLEPITYEYDNKGRLTKYSQDKNIFNYSYNQKGNIQTIKDAKGLITSYEYDLLDRVTSITYPNNIKEYYYYDKEGNILRYVTPNYKDFKFTYNPLSQRTSLTSPLLKSTLYSYNKNRDLTKITYPSSKEINYHYDNSQLSKVTTSNNDEFTYKYSFHNKIDTITRNSNEKTSYSYDGELMTKIRYEGELNQDISFTYNSDFLPNSITYLNGQNIYTYNSDNLLIKAGEFNIQRDTTNSLVTKVSDNTYNSDFLPNSITYLNGQNIYTYNSDNLLIKAGEFNIQRDTTNSLVTKVSDNTYTKLYSYDTKGDIQTIKDNSYEQNILSRYEDGNIKEIKESINSKTSTYLYEYDNLNRLIRVTKDNEITEEYNYDNQGNRISSIINNQIVSASYNSDDELISTLNQNTNEQTHYSYNLDGQLIQKQNNQDITKYSYDAFGNLKEVILPNQTKIAYIYNANNQRIVKLINNEIEEKYLWLNQTTLLGFYDKNNNFARFTYTDERVPISYSDKSGNVFYLSYNHIGSLKAITNKNNQTIKTIDYNSFGSIINETYYDNRGDTIREITYDNEGNIINDTNPSIQTLNIPFTFAGGLYDKDTKLIKFGYREYDSITGRWTSKDPIDFSGGDSNLYGYVLNDPINFVDPWGLAWTDYIPDFPQWLVDGSAGFGDAVTDYSVNILKIYLISVK